jgi:hypothetical protein
LAISHQPAILEVADQAFRLQDGAVVPVVKVRSADRLNSEEGDMNFEQDGHLITDPAKLP